VYGWRRGGFEGRMLARRMMGWALFILVFGMLMPRIDNVAHATGFIAGAGVGWFGAAVRARGGRADRVWKTLAHACTALVVGVALLFLLPNVLRGQQRREVVLYNATVQSTLSAVKAGEKIPSPIEEGPADAEALRDAVNRLLELVRADAPGNDQRVAFLAAHVAWSEWQAGVRCSHQMRFTK
jgi:hypothetical protein